MPIFSLRDSDPQGTLTSTPDDNSTSRNVLETVAALVGAFKKRKQDSLNETLRKKVLDGGGNVGLEYDPATGKTSYKINPQAPDSLAAKIQRYITSQQFGVDPVTGQKVQNPQKPRFGYQGNNIWQQLLGEDADLPASPDGSDQQTPAAPPMRRGVQPSAAPSITVNDPGTGQLSPQEHYNQLRAAGYTKDQARKIAGV